MAIFLTAQAAAAGIVLGILAFSFKNIGYALQKAGVNKTGLDKKVKALKEGNKSDTGADATNGSEDYMDASSKDILKTPIWWVGQVTTLLGAVMLILAYGTEAPLTLIMPFMGVGMFILVLFCRFYLKEQITKKEWLASFVIIVGIILVTLPYSKLEATSNLLGYYYSQYAQIPSLIFFILAFGGIAIAIIWSKKHNWKFASIIFGIAAGDVGGTTLLFQTPFSKALSQIGTSTEPYFGLMAIMGFVGFAIGGVLAITFENIGYMHGEGVLVAPLYAVTQMLFPILGGIVIFDEWQSSPLSSIIIQSIGIIVISFGVFMLSYYNEKKQQQLNSSESS
ncbi:MAG: DMT family transporter [Promethearchaeota archaeon]